MADEDELKELVRYHFSRNYDCKTILSFLEKFHAVNISKRKAASLTEGVQSQWRVCSLSGGCAVSVEGVQS